MANLSYGTVAGVALAAAFTLLNLKSIPLVYTIRLLPSIYGLLSPRFRGRTAKRKQQESSIAGIEPVTAAHPRLFQHHVSHDRAAITDLGINLQKSNSTFFIDGDISRAALLTSLFSEALAVLGPANFILASVQAKFYAGVKPFRRYAVSSRVLTWDERALWLVTYFLQPGTELPAELEVFGGGPAAVVADEKYKKNVYVVLISKHVFKTRLGDRVSPEEVLKTAGLLRTKGQDDGCLGMEDVDRAVNHGLTYVSDCMR